MCNCLRASKNAYYSWLRGKDVKRPPKAKTALLKRIAALSVQSREIYGSQRIQKELEREGLVFSRSHIAVLMRRMGLRSVLKRKFIATTGSGHDLPVFGNRLDRDFHCGELGKRWVSDTTYIRAGGHWNYLTTIIDLADRKVVGWSLSEDMTTDNTVVKAWSMARRSRNIAEGFIFHSDRGSQYASRQMANILGLSTKISQSMSRKADCRDNAVAESFCKTIKYEWIYRFSYKSVLEAYSSIHSYIQWYNTKRLHSTLGYRSPLEMELYIRGLNKKVA